MVSLEEGEVLLKTVRKHWFVMLAFGVVTAFLALLPGAIIYNLNFSQYLGQLFDLAKLQSGHSISWEVFGYSLWLLILWNIFFIEWTDYYLDMLLITDRRIINIEQKGFFNREVISLTYDQVQDITVDVVGVIPTLLHFGTVQIETAGEMRPIVIKMAANPEAARSLILAKELEARRGIK